VEAPFEVELIGLGILSVALGQALFLCPGQAEEEILGGFRSDRFLKVEDFVQLAVVVAAPKLRAILDVNEFQP